MCCGKSWRFHMVWEPENWFGRFLGFPVTMHSIITAAQYRGARLWQQCARRPVSGQAVVTSKRWTNRHRREQGTHLRRGAGVRSSTRVLRLARPGRRARRASPRGGLSSRTLQRARHEACPGSRPKGQRVKPVTARDQAAELVPAYRVRAGRRGGPRWPMAANSSSAVARSATCPGQRMSSVNSSRRAGPWQGRARALRGRSGHRRL